MASCAIVANDIIPELGGPVAAPGLRASAMAAGLRANGIDAHLLVPADAVDAAWSGRLPPAHGDGWTILDRSDIAHHVARHGHDLVVLTGPHAASTISPTLDVPFVFDHFAPKDLEADAAGAPTEHVEELRAHTARMAAASATTWVNGQRKLDALQAELERDDMAASPMVLVEMAVAPTGGIPEDDSPRPLRAGVAGYRQDWSEGGTADAVNAALDLDFEVEVLQPYHWAQVTRADPVTPDERVRTTTGPLPWRAFGRWLHGVDVMLDVFPQTQERTMAMVTRTVVALAHGVPVIHGVDSECAPLIERWNAGWLPQSLMEWTEALRECAQPEVLAEKRLGARQLADDRFDPRRAMAEAARQLLP